MLTIIFITATIVLAIIAAQYALVLMGAIKYNRQNKKAGKYTPETLVSIIIPAHNEEQNIYNTIMSVRSQDHTNFELFVVSNGSTDNTVQEARDAADDDHRIRVIELKQASKVLALNQALKEAKGDLVLVLDADSYLQPNTIVEIVKAFNKDKAMKAANTNVLVGHYKKMTYTHIAQIYEYILSRQNKKAWAALGIEFVIGGAGSVFRRQDLVEVWGYDADTVAEDMDLTFKFIRSGKKIGFIENALILTQPAPSFKALLAQRYRWELGFWQVFKKHGFLKAKPLKYEPLVKGIALFKDYPLKHKLWFILNFARQVTIAIEPVLLPSLVAASIVTGNLWIIGAGWLTAMLAMALMIADNRVLKGVRWFYITEVPGAYWVLYLTGIAKWFAQYKVLFNVKQISNPRLAKNSWSTIRK